MPARMASQDEGEYSFPDDYRNIDEVAGPSPVESPREEQLYHRPSLEDYRQIFATQPAFPNDYGNLDEVGTPAPVERPEEERQHDHRDILEDRRGVPKGKSRTHSDSSRRNLQTQDGLDGAYGNRTSDHPPSLIQTNQRTGAIPTQSSQHLPISQTHVPSSPSTLSSPSPTPQIATFLTQIYTLSYLILFSILGVLARLGLDALTFYPSAPVTTGVLWANFSGSLIFGFLAEDRKLFQEEWGLKHPDVKVGSEDEEQQRRRKRRDEETNVQEKGLENGDADHHHANPLNSNPPTTQNHTSHSPQAQDSDQATSTKQHTSIKKTIPLYIGLSTGFCGSFTSFSSFQRDTFLALANSLPTTPSPSSSSTIPIRNGGFSFLAMLAIPTLTLSLSLSGLILGAHIAIFTMPFSPIIKVRHQRLILDRLAIFLATALWLGSILLIIFVPSQYRAKWRAQVLFACIFAPVGCLTRFYVSLALNGKIKSFPLGTFVVNIVGTGLEGLFYDLQHRPGGNNSSSGGDVVLACQVLAGLQDGLCGCLTTVSTFVGELKGLRRGHAYIYGIVSVVSGILLLQPIMGGVRWGTADGFKRMVC